MKPSELHRLRALLRANDPATGVEGPTREQSERLRRTVLAAVPVPVAGALRLGHRRGFDAPRWAVAAAVVALLAAGGAVLVRVAGGARAEVEAARGPVQTPVPSAPATVEPRASAAAPSSIATPERQVAALAARDRGHRLERAAPRAPFLAAAPAGVDLRPAAPPDITPSGGDSLAEADAPSEADTPSEALAIAALPAPLGRQIQVTAPGGTRIVWILTPSTGP